MPVVVTTSTPLAWTVPVPLVVRFSDTLVSVLDADTPKVGDTPVAALEAARKFAVPPWLIPITDAPVLDWIPWVRNVVSVLLVSV